MPFWDRNCIVFRYGCFVKMNDSSSHKIIVIKDSFIPIINVENDRRCFLHAYKVMINFASMIVNRVVVIFDNRSLVLIVLNFVCRPYFDVRVRRTLTIC
jgi:hypothetical protein